MNEKHEKILKNLLWFCCKRDDAPMSAESHLESAIIDMLRLCPEFKPSNKEIEEIIEDILEKKDTNKCTGLNYLPAYQPMVALAYRVRSQMVVSVV